MGNVLSIGSSTRGNSSRTVNSDRVIMSDENISCNSEPVTCDEDNDSDAFKSCDDESRTKAREAEMSKFKSELMVKREQRKAILNRHRAEKEDLENVVAKERKKNMELYKSNQLLRELLTQNNIEVPDNLTSDREDSDLTKSLLDMREEFELLKSSNMKLRKDLVISNSALQGAFSDIADLNSQNIESIKQIKALKDVVNCSKRMLELREEQLLELKNKLAEIERTMADREASMLSSDLRQEYEKQLKNIRTLRALYEERARLAEVTRQGLARELEEQKAFYQIEVMKTNELKTKVDNMDAEINNLKEMVSNKNSEINSFKDETRGLQAEMSVINKLFSQVLLGYKSKNDLDKLANRLEENHGLLTQMAEKDNGTEASTTLPKLLLELISQVDEVDLNNIVENEASSEKDSSSESQSLGVEISEGASEAGLRSSQIPPVTTPEEIVEKLPKVWRVLMELLSHQNVADPVSEDNKVTTCYKSVETKSGPVLVPSVSQTYIRLKDLIVEKLTLIKEVNRMKQLNSHLESRLGEQEKRLCLVTSELSKTWHVVGRLRRHHHQLHTHEKILKYELQQKRKLLNELKEELEYCREKWEQAREKNTQSEKDWRKLRTEFATRKNKSPTSINNSAESGYSDEKQSDDSTDSNDESECQKNTSIKCTKTKKSTETIPDSSTDLLVAEREEPVSDLLDIAELPLDSHDGHVTENSLSLDASKSEKYAGTEDEACDLGNESCCEESSQIENTPTDNEFSCSTIQHTDSYNTNNIEVNKVESDTNSGISLETPTVDVSKILENVRKQEERLKLKDAKFKKLEANAATLLKQTKSTVEVGHHLNDTLDHILNKPSTSQNVELKSINLELQHSQNNKISFNNEQDNQTIIDNRVSSENDDCLNFEANNVPSSSSKIQGEQYIPQHDPKGILENVRLQNERLNKKDERLDLLEKGSGEVIEMLAGTIQSEDNLLSKIDQMIVGTSDDKVVNNESACAVEDAKIDIAEASTSSDDMTQSARFAARDIRLKKLEEQTKSLVHKVNDTKTKGVKIHYKLQELHNIYSSGSRAGTPSEDKNDETSDNDEKSN